MDQEDANQQVAQHEPIPYDPAKVATADLVALAPYLVKRPDEAVVLLGSRKGQPCGITVTPLADFRVHCGTTGVPLARQWAMQRPTHLTAMIHTRWAGDAFAISESVLDSEFIQTVGIEYEQLRELWVYGDSRWNEGSLLYDDIQLRPASTTDIVLARMWALGLHAYTEPDAPRALLPDFRAIPDGSHLAEQALDEIFWHVAPGDLPDTYMWSWVAEELDSDPATLAATIDHMLAGGAKADHGRWEALGHDSQHHQANATTVALADLADWRAGRQTADRVQSRPGQSFARHVGRLIASGRTARELGLGVTRRFPD
jgi:hypothetical protein